MVKWGQEEQEEQELPDGDVVNPTGPGGSQRFPDWPEALLLVLGSPLTTRQDPEMSERIGAIDDFLPLTSHHVTASQ